MANVFQPVAKAATTSGKVGQTTNNEKLECWHVDVNATTESSWKPTRAKCKLPPPWRDGSLGEGLSPDPSSHHVTRMARWPHQKKQKGIIWIYDIRFTTSPQVLMDAKQSRLLRKLMMFVHLNDANEDPCEMRVMPCIWSSKYSIDRHRNYICSDWWNIGSQI